MDPEQLARLLAENLERQMPTLLGHIMSRVQPRVTVDRNIMNQTYEFQIDLILDGQRLASMRTPITDDVLEDLRPQGPRMSRQLESRDRALEDMYRYYGDQPVGTRPPPPTPTRRDPTPPGLRTRVSVLPTGAPALRDPARRLDFGFDDEQ